MAVKRCFLLADEFEIIPVDYGRVEEGEMSRRSRGGSSLASCSEFSLASGRTRMRIPGGRSRCENSTIESHTVCKLSAAVHASIPHDADDSPKVADALQRIAIHKHQICSLADFDGT